VAKAETTVFDSDVKAAQAVMSSMQPAAGVLPGVPQGLA